MRMCHDKNNTVKRTILIRTHNKVQSFKRIIKGSLAKWLSVRLRNKWLRVRIPLQSPRGYLTRFHTIDHLK